MRLLSTISAVAFLAATPCMAQMVIGGPDRDGGHRDTHERLVERNYRGASHERAEAKEHREIEREHSTNRERQGGERPEFGR